MKKDLKSYVYCIYSDKSAKLQRGMRVFSFIVFDSTGFIDCTAKIKYFAATEHMPRLI